MSRFRGQLAGLLVVPVVVAEWFSAVWMNPSGKRETEYPMFPPMIERTDFELIPENYKKTARALQCSGGWIGNVNHAHHPPIRLGWFEWDRQKTVSSAEAFQHPPEGCMRSVGMKIDRVYPPRFFGTGARQLTFESSRFLPEKGGSVPTFVFKSIWWSERPETALLRQKHRASHDGGWRELTVSMALGRFQPEKTRVLMAVVSGLPTEELAWKWFEKQALANLRWVEPRPASRP